MTESLDTGRINWSSEAVLCLLSSEDDPNPCKVGRGQLGDMISLAMARPPLERDRLFIACEGTDRALRWDIVVALAARADCPLII